MSEPYPVATLRELGAPIAVGRTAEVFEYGEDRVLRLLSPEIPARFGEQEASIAEFVHALFSNAPRCFGTTVVEGRCGIIYERIVGPSVDREVRRRLWTVDRLGRSLGDLHAAMHQASGVGLPEQLLAFQTAIERASADLSAEAREGALARLEGLPQGSSVCHGDLHPGNVVLGRDRAVVIDWDSACSGSPAADVARAVYLMRDTPMRGPRILRPVVQAVRRRFMRAYLARYREIRPLDVAELQAWRLPVLAARLAEGIDGERELLRTQITRELE